MVKKKRSFFQKAQDWLDKKCQQIALKQEEKQREFKIKEIEERLKERDEDRERYKEELRDRINYF